MDPQILKETYEQIENKSLNIVNKHITKLISENENSIALHIRGKDYAHMGLCKNSYYIGALEYLIERLDYYKIFLFSDEPNYARHMLNTRNIEYTFIDNESDIDTLYLMTLCKHFIISNSSYSFWGAYFGEKNGGIIFSPNEWVTIDLSPSPVPDRWIKISDTINSYKINEVEIDRIKKEIHISQFNEAINNWFAENGDETLRVNFNFLNNESIVFDLGGYFGDWTEAINGKYNSKIYVFEPMKKLYNNIKDRFINNKNILAFNFGLGSKEEDLNFGDSENSSGAFNIKEKQGKNNM
jgi:hypothetical protein